MKSSKDSFPSDIHNLNEIAGNMTKITPKVLTEVSPVKTKPSSPQEKEVGKINDSHRQIKG